MEIPYILFNSDRSDFKLMCPIIKYNGISLDNSCKTNSDVESFDGIYKTDAAESLKRLKTLANEEPHIANLTDTNKILATCDKYQNILSKKLYLQTIDDWADQGEFRRINNLNSPFFGGDVNQYKINTNKTLQEDPKSPAEKLHKIIDIEANIEEHNTDDTENTRIQKIKEILRSINYLSASAKNKYETKINNKKTKNKILKNVIIYIITPIIFLTAFITLTPQFVIYASSLMFFRAIPLVNGIPLLHSIIITSLITLIVYIMDKYFSKYLYQEKIKNKHDIYEYTIKLGMLAGIDSLNILDSNSDNNKILAINPENNPDQTEAVKIFIEYLEKIYDNTIFADKEYLIVAVVSALNFPEEHISNLVNVYNKSNKKEELTEDHYIKQILKPSFLGRYDRVRTARIAINFAWSLIKIKYSELYVVQIDESNFSKDDKNSLKENLNNLSNVKGSSVVTCLCNWLNNLNKKNIPKISQSDIAKVNSDFIIKGKVLFPIDGLDAPISYENFYLISSKARYVQEHQGSASIDLETLVSANQGR